MQSRCSLARWSRMRWQVTTGTGVEGAGGPRGAAEPGSPGWTGPTVLSRGQGPVEGAGPGQGAACRVRAEAAWYGLVRVWVVAAGTRTGRRPWPVAPAAGQIVERPRERAASKARGGGRAPGRHPARRHPLAWHEDGAEVVRASVGGGAVVRADSGHRRRLNGSGTRGARGLRRAGAGRAVGGWSASAWRLALAVFARG